jgi:6-phospho-beta-glucosidase
MKVTVIGGGSTYTPELINGFLERATIFPMTDLWLMDISEERLSIVGSFVRRIVKAQNSPFSVHLTTDLEEAVHGARYIITQIRVGGMEARRRDEYLGRRHNLVGQETTGVGGMAKALRTIPVILKVAQKMRERAPGALLVNFTNPAGLITEALQRYAPDIPSAGVCNVPITAKMTILERLEAQTGERIDPVRAELKTLGLNHLSWHHGFSLDGEDIWPQILKTYIAELEEQEEPEWDSATIRALGMIPNYYLKYYYDTERQVTAQAEWPPSRAEEVMQIEADLLRQYAEPARSQAPEDLMKRGGAYYSTAATQLLAAHHNDTGETHVLNTAHRGAIPGWPADWVLEMPCRVDARGIHPLPTRPLPPVCFGLLALVKTFEILTVEAAVHGDRDAAHLALLAHPLGPAADRISTMLDDLLESNRTDLPEFWFQ